MENTDFVGVESLLEAENRAFLDLTYAHVMDSGARRFANRFCFGDVLKCSEENLLLTQRMKAEVNDTSYVMLSKCSRQEGYEETHNWYNYGITDYGDIMKEFILMKFNASSSMLSTDYCKVLDTIYTDVLKNKKQVWTYVVFFQIARTELRPSYPSKYLRAI